MSNSLNRIAVAAILLWAAWIQDAYMVVFALAIIAFAFIEAYRERTDAILSDTDRQVLDIIRAIEKQETDI